MKRTIALVACLFLAASGPQLTERQRAMHALNRLGFGARPGDVDRVVAIGVDKWIDQQLHPERIADDRVESELKKYKTLTMSDDEVMREFALPLFEARRAKKEGLTAADLRKKLPPDKRPQRLIAEVSAQRILRAADSERQLNEVMADFWMNHFNVFAGKGIDRFLVASYERDAIRPHMWGRFEDLLLATAKSPAMLFYLDNARSVAAPENRAGLARMAKKGGLNENYAREIMELHTLGVDGGYSQKDVTELARIFTGWSIERPRDGKTGFVFRSRLHDSGSKTVLGQKFPAGGGVEEGERMIRFLSRHPATAHHIATQLCQRLVSDSPSPALVDRVAKRYLDTNGDIRETVRAVITSPEFWDPSNYRSKVKSPFEYAISAVRASGGHIDDPIPLGRELEKIGERLYYAQPPTGYSDTSDAWVNSGALLARLNFAIALAGGKMPGITVDVAKLGGTTDALAASLTGGDLSAATRKTIVARGGDPQLVAGLILGSPEFQRQ
jgi:uncharacterized protein (DUF1800 family)